MKTNRSLEMEKSIKAGSHGAIPTRQSDSLRSTKGLHSSFIWRTLSRMSPISLTRSMRDNREADPTATLSKIWIVQQVRLSMRSTGSDWPKILW